MLCALRASRPRSKQEACRRSPTRENAHHILQQLLLDLEYLERRTVTKMLSLPPEAYEYNIDAVCARRNFQGARGDWSPLLNFGSAKIIRAYLYGILSQPRPFCSCKNARMLTTINNSSWYHPGDSKTGLANTQDIARSRNSNGALSVVVDNYTA